MTSAPERLCLSEPRRRGLASAVDDESLPDWRCFLLLSPPLPACAASTSPAAAICVHKVSVRLIAIAKTATVHAADSRMHNTFTYENEGV